MNETLLITFGCSWTYGAGVGYQPGMTQEEYKKIAWDSNICDQWSYRGLLCKQLDMTNLNFAHGQSSNQAQFYYAKKYFGSEEFSHAQKFYKKIIVLHAITSTARNFYFDSNLNKIRHVKYDVDIDFSKFMINNFYSHDFEVQQLAIEMNFWNVFYSSVGIKNIWVDTFNHHNYNTHIDNLLDYENCRDLLSQLCVKNNIAVVNKNQYHKSNWIVDDDRVKNMIDCGMLNPISKHPTKQGHQQLADIISPVLKSLL